MPELRSLIANMARQMYDDVRFVTEANALQPLDEDTTRHINHLLRLTRECYPNVRVLEPFQEMAPRTIKYKDTVMILGQLKEVLGLLESAEMPVAGPSLIRSSGSSNSVPLPSLSPVSAIPVSSKAAAITPQPQMPAKPPARQTTAFPYSAVTDADEVVSPLRPPTPMPKPRVVPGAPIMPPSPMPPGAPAATKPVSDEELYGPNPPARRNADGTVPFSLDDEH